MVSVSDVEQLRNHFPRDTVESLVVPIIAEYPTIPPGRRVSRFRGSQEIGELYFTLALLPFVSVHRMAGVGVPRIRQLDRLVIPAQ